LLLDWLCRGGSPVRPAATWAGLAVGPPNSRYGSEFTGSNYARQPVSFAAAQSPAGTASNQNALRFGPFGSWVTVAGLQIWDSSTQGSMLWQGLLQTARTCVPNDSFDIGVGGLTCGLD
jgi:hypothetical protein